LQRPIESTTAQPQNGSLGRSLAAPPSARSQASHLGANCNGECCSHKIIGPAGIDRCPARTATSRCFAAVRFCVNAVAVAVAVLRLCCSAAVPFCDVPFCDVPFCDVPFCDVPFCDVPLPFAR
jgi:hypothetical protein